MGYVLLPEGSYANPEKLKSLKTGQYQQRLTFISGVGVTLLPVYT